jgi:hypothetical protein
MEGLSCAAVGLCMLMTVSVAGQSLTIPETVAAYPEIKSHRQIRVVDVAIIPLSELTAKADVVVVGRLVKRTSYLTPDERRILTDYEVVPRHVLVDRVATAVRERPGQAPSMVVTVEGGDVVVNGVPVTVIDATRTQWTDGAELLLFLSKAEASNRFRLLGGSAGAFEVRSGDGRLKGLKSGGKAEDVDGVALEQVVQRILAER